MTHPSQLARDRRGKAPAGRTALVHRVGRSLAALGDWWPARVTLPALFLLIALPTTSFLALAVPLGEVPDEPAHIDRAESLRHGEIIVGRKMFPDLGVPLAGGKIDPAPGLAGSTWTGSVPLPQKKLTAARVAQLDAIGWWNHRQFVAFPNTAVYMPLFYLPAAIGLAVGRAAGLTPHASDLLARALGAICFTLLGTLVLLAARRGRRLLFAGLTVPMTLWLAASVNEDGLMIAGYALAAALLTRASGARGGAWWGAGLALGLAIAVKPPYLPLAAMMLLPVALTRAASWRGRELRGLLFGVALASVPALLWAAAMAHFVATPVRIDPPAHPGPLWPGDPHALFRGPDMAAQLRVLLHDPALLLTLPFRTIAADWSFKPHELIGVLGPLDLVLPQPLYAFWFAALGLAVIGDLLAAPGEAVPTSSALSIAIALAAAALTVLAIYDIQYLSWTDVGATRIEGVQGRYLLPVLVMVAAALPVWPVRNGRFWRGMLTLPVAGMALFGLVYLPWLVVTTYYLR